MKLNTLLSIYAVVAAISCVLYLFFPAVALAIYSSDAAGVHDPRAALLFQMVGALLGGLAVMAWLGRNAVPSECRNAMVNGLAAANGLAAVVTLVAATSGGFNQYTWGPFVTCVLFAIGFVVLGPGLAAKPPKPAVNG